MHIAAPTPRSARAFPLEPMMVLDEVRTVVGSALQLGARAKSLNEDSALLGAVPELDSIAVVNVITALEEHFGISVADDEIDASSFETLGSLARFVEGKLAG
jgi:acyl carrier protein